MVGCCAEMPPPLTTSNSCASSGRSSDPAFAFVVELIVISIRCPDGLLGPIAGAYATIASGSDVMVNTKCSIFSFRGPRLVTKFELVINRTTAKAMGWTP
jgi:hypothetical protein